MRTGEKGTRVARLAGLLAALAMAASAPVPAQAQAQAPRGACMVSDPTGTPLNLRESPGGPITGSLENGHIVWLVTTERDGRGRTWALVEERRGEPIGWVFREYISCRQ